MCCSPKKANAMPTTESPVDLAAVVLRVDDMACGNRAQAIKNSVEGALPGTEASADMVTKTVTVSGTTNLAKVRRAFAAAGYMPGRATLRRRPARRNDNFRSGSA
jgi:copper chaperone